MEVRVSLARDPCLPSSSLPKVSSFFSSFLYLWLAVFGLVLICCKVFATLLLSYYNIKISKEWLGNLFLDGNGDLVLSDGVNTNV